MADEQVTITNSDGPEYFYALDADAIKLVLHPMATSELSMIFAQYAWVLVAQRYRRRFLNLWPHRLATWWWYHKKYDARFYGWYTKHPEKGEIRVSPNRMRFGTCTFK